MVSAPCAETETVTVVRSLHTFAGIQNWTQLSRIADTMDMLG